MIFQTPYGVSCMTARATIHWQQVITMPPLFEDAGVCAMSSKALTRSWCCCWQRWCPHSSGSAFPDSVNNREAERRRVSLVAAVQCLLTAVKEHVVLTPLHMCLPNT